MSNIRRLVWYFYRPILVWNVSFSLTCIALIIIYGPKVIGFVFFFKLVGYASTTFLQSYSAKNVYMYYRNAGYSIRRMYAYVYSIDLLIYFLMVLTYLLIQHEIIKGR